MSEDRIAVSEGEVRTFREGADCWNPLADEDIKRGLEAVLNETPDWIVEAWATARRVGSE